MNIFYRLLICILLLGGSTQPIDWKYVIPWTTTTLFLSGWIFSAFRFHTKIDAADAQIAELKANQLTENNKAKLRKYNLCESLLKATTNQEEGGYILHVSQFPSKEKVYLEVNGNKKLFIENSQFISTHLNRLSKGSIKRELGGLGVQFNDSDDEDENSKIFALSDE